MQGLRKILRAVTIALCGAIGLYLLVDAGLNGSADYQFLVSAGLLLFPLGMAVAWFRSPL